jgi:TPR repeat protein
MKGLRILALLVLLTAQGGVLAGWDEGVAAYDSGDYATALKELRPLAEQGEASAQGNLGVMYAKGQGVPQDYKEAVKWYRKAAEQGDATAQNNLGGMYFDGKGVPPDYVQAHMWFNLAGAAGNDEAVKKRDMVAEQMTPTQIAEAQKLAREWMQKHP